MTEEQKDILIAKMLDSASDLSDKELETIMNDNELRDIHEMSSAISRACAVQPELDMSEEWARFRPRLRRKPSPVNRILRVAAVFLCVMLVSGIMVKMTDHMFTSEKQALIAKAEEPEKSDINIPPAMITPDTVKTCVPRTSPAKRKRTTASSATLLAKAEISEADKQEPSADLDIDEYLRIRQAEIDNDLAIQAAETFEKQHQAMKPLLDFAGVSEDYYNDYLTNFTMQ